MTRQQPFPGPGRRCSPASGKTPARLCVRLAKGHRDAIIGACDAALPNEGCGLLLGWRDDAVAEITAVLPADNTLASPHRYEIAPETVLAAERRARAAGSLLLGAWHSHPGGAAIPSAIDRAEAWPDWCTVIVGLAAPGRPELRAWRLVGEDFVEDALEIM
ncbi:MAG: M67 family metallopeptidase [Gammaproteobacteria bacterium]